MSAEAPQPYNPAWLNALTDAQEQPPEIKEFSRQKHDSGGEHVIWLLWQYQEKPSGAPLQREQGLVFWTAGADP